MPTDEQRKLIEGVLEVRQEAIAGALVEEAEVLIPAVVRSTLDKIQSVVRDKFTRQVVADITKQQIATYRAQVARGGTNIVDRVLRDNGDGTVTATTRTIFKPWLNDMTKRDQEEILRIIGEGQRGGMHPRQIARRLKDHFEGTNHNAATAARTEAQKIRTDARVATYRETGVRHLEYIAVGDDKTRPEHAARDGKIYPIEKAPWLGEPNCRCTLVDADYKVDEKGARVEKNDAIVITEEELDT